MLFRPGAAELAIIHDTADKTAALEDARRFAGLADIKLIEIEGTDQRFLPSGGMEHLIDAAVGFFQRQWRFRSGN